MSHVITELRHELKSDPNPIVGIDVVNSGDLLLFYVKRRLINNKSFTWSGVYQKFDFKIVVDVGYLAAQILKKPKLLTSTLEELMLKVDVEIMRPIIANGSLRRKWESSVVLSEEEVKVAMYEVLSNCKQGY
ncbi:hypothetical protein K7X08_009943 [Anisodus acutangulus]|uniref:Uncharacterized protein n=1 Tax=Anisodus acutangulus TaxID=402998 RepID=A0A9Q1N086_9SOLA|nr:hypothetical protein K7X08_009943 [Anisodus acutangulus]